ncbi:MAG: hypothetical protein IPM24_20790 [Bryobacterales bacterium]|nr:hypothetical protein [Bryobacterales bacterium]
MFWVRTIFPEDARVEVGTYELTPTNENGAQVCRLFAEFLANRPPEFRDALGFVKRDGMELEWAAVQGGSALATFYDQGSPLSMGILLSGVNQASDAEILSLLRGMVLDPMLGDEAERCAGGPERPLLLNVVFPGAPEQTPVVQLLAASLASVYFRTIHQLHQEQS